MQALTSLKREITLFRLLHETLGDSAAIVALLDWNLEQAPYFIESEHIDGGNLAEWAEAQGGLSQVPLATRLELMAQVAEALAAAHSVGVLHKDMKPANVLIENVAANDGAAPRSRVKLCDFGSGGMLDQERLTALGITRLGFTQAIADRSTSGTPMYLAPEVLAGQPSTVRADIYALGVMLYQLVVGDFHKTLAPGWEQEVEDELLREDIALAAAGDTVRRLADAATFAQRLRNLESRRRQRLEERQAKEAAAQALREIERARQESERLRARRTGMRIAVAVLLAGLVVSSALFVDAQRERKHAETEAVHAKAVSDFLNSDVLSVISSGDHPVKDLTVKQLLDAASQQVEKRFASQPDVAIDIDYSLGMSYYRLEHLREAEQLLDRALMVAERRKEFPDEKAMRLVGNLMWIKNDMGSLPQTIAHYEQILELGKQHLGTTNRSVLELTEQLAGGHIALGQWKQGAQEYRQVLRDR